MAGLVALVIYLCRAGLEKQGLHASAWAYFNYLADAFLHGQVSLRLHPGTTQDLIVYGNRLYLYWQPFPALVVAPLVALFGVTVSDVIYTAVCGALAVALIAQLLVVLDRSGLAPLTVERRGLLVGANAFGSVLLILAPVGGVWFTQQLIGLLCVLLATIAALAMRGRMGYFLTGLALAAALGTRVSLLGNGLWLAYFLLDRDRRQALRWRFVAIVCGLLPIAIAGGLLGWYNAARFGNPLELGLRWHNMIGFFRADYERYGLFNLHYLPRNIYYQFIAYPLFTREQWLGGGLFWMTPIFLGAPYALWRRWREPLTWWLLASCVLVYLPIGFLMGTGYFTFGPRYLLDLVVPLLVLTAWGIRCWRLTLLQVLTVIGWGTYAVGSAMWLVYGYLQQ